MNANPCSPKLALRTRHLCILIIEKNSYFLCLAKTDKYQRGLENFCTIHLLLEIWKLIGRVFRHNMQVPPDDQLKTFVFIDFALPCRWYDIYISEGAWHVLCLVYTCMYKVGCLVLCIYVCTYLHGYIYACTYMHICIYACKYMHILTVTDFMSILWYYLPFIIYITLQVSVRIIYSFIVSWCWILNTLCHILPFYLACCFHLKCVLCITIIKMMKIWPNVSPIWNCFYVLYMLKNLDCCWLLSSTLNTFFSEIRVVVDTLSQAAQRLSRYICYIASEDWRATLSHIMAHLLFIWLFQLYFNRLLWNSSLYLLI